MKNQQTAILRGTALFGCLALCVLILVLVSHNRVRAGIAESSSRQDWPVYGGDASGDRYSPLSQINRDNVKQLQVAWKVDVATEGGLQVNPLIVGRTMFVYSPSEQIMALDAATGKKMWTFDPGIKATQPSRGFSYWSSNNESILFAGVMDHLYALDPATGKAVTSFGDDGKIDLRKDLGNDDFANNFALLTTPGAIYKDIIIVGFRAPETHPAPHGDIRAYDVHTGKLRWSFHTIPHPGETGYETWPKDAWKTAGAANNWTGMVVDTKRGIVFTPTGSAVDDFYGSDRLGNDLYANTLLAIDANTGKLLWHFQGVHHDIWDRDFPSPPALVTVHRDGKSIDAIAQTTKQGFVFLFDRTTGAPLFPIDEKPYPASTVPGEVASATQPTPLAPAPFSRQQLTADMLTNRTPEAHAWAEEQFKAFRSDGIFVPLSVGKETIILPGYDGGAEWGGPAVDPDKAIIYINANDVAWTGSLAENKAGGGLGATIYQSQCALCHGDDRKGSPPQFPSLVGIDQRLSATAISDVLHNGRGRMPAFPGLQGEKLDAVVKYLRDGDKPDTSRVDSKTEVVSAGDTLKYRFTGYKKFLDPEGYPAVAPPWGTLNAIDLNTGKYLWKIPFGEYPDLAAKGMKNTGSENYGGPVLTAGGVLIIAATNYDHKIRAFNSENGTLLWEADLPFAGNATPATYMVDGKQYIVIATSGARDRKGPQGAAYVAFALP